jgi:transcriptional regulator GlxA family with amidase domain
MGLDPTSTIRSMSWTVGILLFDQMEELDFVGPWEVFSAARREGDRVVTIAEAGADAMVRAAKGLRVLADCGLDDHPPLDVLVVPGGMGTRREVGNERLLGWIREVDTSTRWTTSVCTGSLLLAAAGPAAGKRVTTHFGFVEALRDRALAAEVLAGPRWVVDGKVVTSAGVSAGIDMALWVVGQLDGVDHARRTQRAIEYDPAPPYQADV